MLKAFVEEPKVMDGTLIPAVAWNGRPKVFERLYFTLQAREADGTARPRT
jgi:hypothetical protein